MTKPPSKRVFARKLSPENKRTLLQEARWSTGYNQEQAAANISILLNKNISYSLYQKIEQGRAGVLISDAQKIMQYWQQATTAMLGYSFDDFWKSDLIIKRNGKEIN